MKLLDVRECRGKRINLSSYTHILAYHACRSESESNYRTYGLKPYTKDEALSAAIQLLTSDRISAADVEAELNNLWAINQSTNVYLMLETTEFLSTSTHYLIYGSEFMNALAMHLGCRDALTKIGRPMFVVCAVPIAEISPGWLNGLTDAIKRKDTAYWSIAVESVAANNIIGFLYPTGCVRDPYTNALRKLG